MVIRGRLDLWSQHYEPWFVPTEVIRESATGIPGILRIRVDRREDIKQMLDVHILGCTCDPSCFLEAGFVGINFGR